MDDIIGHEKILKFFDNVIQHDNLSHAYCFIGPKSVGKKTVAQEIASKILKVERKKVFISPDFSLIERTINEKTGKTRKDISIDQIRGLTSILSQSSFIKNGYKIAIIDEADIMSVGASNALLKTLEEPNKKTIIFLITNDESKLLPTIQSRCQMIYFSLVANSKIEKKIESKEIVHHAHGLPGKAILWNEDNEKFEEYKKEVQRFQNLLGKSFYEKLKLVDKLFGDKSDHILARGGLQNALDVWQIELHNLIKQKKINTDSFCKINDHIKQARILLAKNIHPRLLIEHILLYI